MKNLITTKRFIFPAAILILANALISSVFAQNNALSKKEVRKGWQLLFDGKTLNGWRGYNSDNVFNCWSVSDGELVCKGEGGSVSAGDLVTTRDFDNFELSLDWNISNQGNSGIFYHVHEGTVYDAAYETGPEYQLIDDAGWPERLEIWQQTAADYAMHPAKSNKVLHPAGTWNNSRIIYRGGHVEHWLNGKKVVEFEAYIPEWDSLKAQSKWKDFPDYARFKSGKIGLQNHGSGVKFRNIKVRELK